MKVINLLLVVIMLPFYTIAYGIAKATRMKGHEDMPSLAELFEMI